MNLSNISNFLNVKINIQSSEKDLKKFELNYKKNQESSIKVLDGKVIKKGQTIYIVA
jgi:hypothetical protein